jgi:hypothetical protein
MMWLRLTKLGLCLGCLAAAPVASRADDPPNRDARPVPSAAVPAFVPYGPPQADHAAAPAGRAPAVTLTRPAETRPVTQPAPWPVTRREPAPSVGIIVRTQHTQPAAPPLAPPPATPPRPLPTFVVRGQMAEGAERMLPSSADVAAAQARPLAVLGAPVPPGTPIAPVQAAANPVAPVQAAVKPIVPVQGTDNPSNVPAAPLSVTSPYSVYGTVTGLPIVGPPVIYDAAPGSLFNDPLTNPRFWAGFEFLYWWTNGYHLPVLVTTSPATTPQALQGVLGVPGTTVLYGGNNTSSGPIPGGRITFGWNFDPCGTCGIMGSYFFLGRKQDNFSAAGGVLARPFFNLNSGMNDRELTSTPGTNAGDVFKLNGAVNVSNFSDFQGGDINLTKLLCADCTYSVYGFAGFRYLDLHEKTTITESVISLAAVPGFPIFNPGNMIMVQDSFATRNQFFGGQVGLYGELRRNRWFVGSQVQLGLGVTHETITINGSQTVTTPAGAMQTFNGGLLALPSNIGNFTANKFSVVPQIGLRVGYNVTDNLRLFVGYDFLYWSNVVRPGDQIDTTLNVTQIPNFAPPGLFPTSPIVRPIVPFHTTGFFAQGISAGFQLRY